MSQRKSEDRFGVPLCQRGFSSSGADCHTAVEAAGSKNEVEWFHERGVDCFKLAGLLWMAFLAAKEHREDPLPTMRAVLFLHENGVLQ